MTTHAERFSQPSQFASRPEVPAYPYDPCFVSDVNEVWRPCFASVTPSHALGSLSASLDPSRYIS